MVAWLVKLLDSWCTGYLACARCSARGLFSSIGPNSIPDSCNDSLQLSTTKRCPNCSGTGKVWWYFFPSANGPLSPNCFKANMPIYFSRHYLSTLFKHTLSVWHNFWGLLGIFLFICLNLIAILQVMCPSCLCTGMAMTSEHDPRIDPFD